MSGRCEAMGNADYEGITRPSADGKRRLFVGTIRELPDRLDKPLHWTKPRKIFVNSMSDLFGEGVSDEFIAAVFGVMAACSQHTFQILTKRAERLLDFFGRAYSPWFALPLPNVWLGVSVEDRKHGLPRIDDLRKVPAAVRFLSVEPLLEDLGKLDLTGIHWVIVGGESGPGARPMHPDWVRSIRDQCVAAGVPFFFKQWGEWWPQTQGSVGTGFAKIGKKNAGRLLDGREWNEVPK